MTPISMESKVSELEVVLKTNGKAGAASLLRNMILKAEANLVYGAGMRRWLQGGGTLKLRELVKPFGDYWKGVEFANIVDELDSAMCKLN